MDAVENYGRYRDVDGDGIPYRTLPGSGLDQFFTGELDTMKTEYTAKIQ